MSNSIFEKYRAAKPDDLANVSEPPTEETDDYGAFGYLRGTRDRALMLELRKKDGSIKAVGYAWLHEAELDPSGRIILHVASQTITISGRNLNTENRPNIRLFHGISRHRVPFIQEADQVACMRAGTQDTLIEKIEW